MPRRMAIVASLSHAYSTAHPKPISPAAMAATLREIWPAPPDLPETAAQRFTVARGVSSEKARFRSLGGHPASPRLVV